MVLAAVPTSTVPTSTVPSSTDHSVRSAIQRLGREFPQLGPSVPVVVRTCWEDLRGAPADALPELVERLARQRLQLSLA